MAERLKNNKAEVDKLLLLEGTTVNSYVNENSYWDELCDAVTQKDTAWVSENMATPLGLPLYKADILNIIDYDGNTIYKKQWNKNYAEAAIKLPEHISFLDTLKSKIINNYCIKTGSNYALITAASIVHSNDYSRKEKPLGFLIVGKRLDSSYLNSLALLNSDFKYSYIKKGYPQEENINVAEAQLTFTKSINCINGLPVRIKVTAQVPEIKVYSGYVRYSLISFLILVSAVIFLLFYFFIKRFFDPLIKISLALQKKSSAALQNLKKENTDLGQVALLIDTHFSQTGALEAEINSRKKSEAALTQALEGVKKSTFEKVKAEQAAEAKSEFLSIMSHEIRTPINGVIGIANLLKEENLTAKQQEYISILNFSAKHLMSLVTDILDFSKIESGKVDFEKSSFDLHQICHSLYHMHKVNADEKGVKLLYTPDKNFNSALYGDAVRLNQVLTNLLSNALKFTQKGTVSLTYKMLAESESACTVEFRIKDSGIGMTEEEQERIFDGFSQANNKISGEFGGTGLGLTICKKLVELQGGKIRVFSQPGHGSEFIFYIIFEKYAFAPVVADLPVITSRSQNLLNGMKVLVAEDNKINIIVIKNFLEKWGINYKIGNTGKEAVDLVCNEPFDLVLMDLHMPEMNGEDATKIIRSNDNVKISKLPIIALTANASADTQRKLLNEGFDNYISKPFNPDNLFKLLKKYYYEN